MGGDVERVRREDCSKMKHGPDFLPWKILVGPSDWENHSSGVCGAERYRTQNLPPGGMGPGLYELGIDITSSKEGHRVRDLDPRRVITVYIGIADNVRTRLQEYGRNGSHLDGGKSINLPHENEGLGLFKDVFSKGFSIVFRWVPMKSRKEAEETESWLLKQFDYAWNRGGNGARRPHDIIPMLDKTKIISRKTRSCGALTKCRASTLQINGKLPSEDSEVGPSHLKLLLGLQTTMISRSRPQLVSRRFAVYERYICGVIMDNGLSCTNIPIEGNKRCIHHKGHRVHGSFSKLVGEDSIFSSACGMILEDGSICQSSPVHGRKRCELHKGKRIPTRWLVETKTTSNYPILDHTLPLAKCTDYKAQRLPCLFSESVGEYGSSSSACGMILEDGSTCNSSPVPGRKRCELHKGERIPASARPSIEIKTTSKYPSPDFSLPSLKSNPLPSRPISWHHMADEGYSRCGVELGEGRFCRRLPVEGRKRCEEHKGKRVTTNVSLQFVSWSHAADDICGVSIGNGFYCRNRPPSGRKRCDAHKGQRLYGSCSSGVMVDYGGFSGVCGVTMRNGSTCMSSPAPGRKRCGRHKGMRA